MKKLTIKNIELNELQDEALLLYIRLLFHAAQQPRKKIKWGDHTEQLGYGVIFRDEVPKDLLKRLKSEYALVDFKESNIGCLIKIENWEDICPDDAKGTVLDAPDLSTLKEQQDGTMWLVKYMHLKILNLMPDNLTVKKAKAKKWEEDMRRIRVIDRRPAREIKAVIDFALQHDFWQKNILSPDKLRKQYDRLKLEMNKTENKPVAKKSNMNYFN